MPATATRNPGKTMFVKEVLHDNRLANTEDPAEITRLKSAMTRGFYGE